MLNNEQIMKLSKALNRQSARANRLQGVEPSKQFELQYNRLLNGFARLLIQISRKVLDGLYQQNIIQDESFVSMFPAFQIEKQVAEYEDYVIDKMMKLYRNEEQLHRKEFVKGLKSKIGIDVSMVLSDVNLSDLMETRIQDNINLIKSIPKEYFEDVEKVIRFGIDGGTDYFSVKGGIKDYINKGVLRKNETLKSRAKLIARDQTSKFNSSLNEFRQKDIGVTHYIWQTVGDEDVRESHQENDGKTFRWDSPPATGHPGTEVQCRCIADPVLDTLISRLSA